MKRASFVYAFLAVSLVASSAFAELDLSTIETTFTAASSKLEDFIVVVLGPLATLWVGRKFIKSTNRS